MIHVSKTDLSIVVYVLECPGLLGIGGKLWDSSLILTKFLHQTSSGHFLENRKLVELGSGTGLVGISLGLLPSLPSSVILTDIEEVVPLIAANIKLNSILNCRNNTSILSSCTHMWGDSFLPHELRKCELIIGSDIIYDPIGYSPLVASIRNIMDGSSSSQRHLIAIIAHRHRNPDDYK